MNTSLIAHISLMCVAFPIFGLCAIIAKKANHDKLYILLKMVAYLSTFLSIFFVSNSYQQFGPEYKLHKYIGYSVWIILSYHAFWVFVKPCILPILNHFECLKDNFKYFCRKRNKCYKIASVFYEWSTHIFIEYLLFVLFYPLLLTGMACHYQLCENAPMNCIGHWLLGGCLIIYGVLLMRWHIIFTQWTNRVKMFALKRKRLVECIAFLLFGILYTFGEYIFSKMHQTQQMDKDESMDIGVHIKNKTEKATETGTGTEMEKQMEMETSTQHTALAGIPYIAGGLFGLVIEFLPLRESKLRVINRSPKNNANSLQHHYIDTNQFDIVPGVLFLITGFATMDHKQETHFSTSMHFIFGLTLSLAGFSRFTYSFIANEIHIRNVGIVNGLLLVAAGVILTASSRGFMQLAHKHLGDHPTSYALYLTVLVYIIAIYTWTIAFFFTKIKKLKNYTTLTKNTNVCSEENLFTISDKMEMDNKESGTTVVPINNAVTLQTNATVFDTIIVANPT